MTHKRLAIVGAGDLGLQIAKIAIHDKHFNEVCFFDDYLSEETIYGFKVLGKISEIYSFYKMNFFDEFIIAIGYKHLKFKSDIYFKYKDIIPLATIVHSSSIICSTAIINKGTVIYAGCIIDTNVNVGSNVILNLGVTISHDTIIADHTFIAPRVCIAGYSKVGTCCFIGVSSILIDNLTISDSILIGAGSLVLKDISIPGKYYGHPIK